MEAPVVSMVSSATSARTHDTSVERIIHAILSGRWRPQIESIRNKFRRVFEESGDCAEAKRAVDSQKKRLPAVMLSGRFSRRANDALILHSGLFCADIDALGERVSEVRQKLCSCPHVWALFLSPTGNGLKVVVRVVVDAEKHNASFRAVEQLVRELTGVQVDQACKDVARLCFVSYDPDAYYNSAAVELPELPPLVESEKAEFHAAYPSSVPDVDERRRIAREVIGEVEWTSGSRGFCTCPGADLHTTPDGERDCELHLDGAPSIHCFHGSCAAILGEVNRELRSRIGKAERASERLVPLSCGSVPRLAELPSAPAPYTVPPLALLPAALRDYVWAAAESLKVDLSYILLPLLCAVASAIANSRSIQLKRGFIQPPIIWSAFIGRSGSRKSPALEAGCFAVREHERELIRQNKAALDQYEEELALWEATKKNLRGAKPHPPPMLTCWMDDLTLAALADALESNPAGVLVVKDELSHWFSAMDQYHDARGSDVSRWLSLHTGVLCGLDRKTDRRRYRLFNPRVSITGGIQPAVLARVLTPDFFERGLPARFLFAAPPTRPDFWSEKTVAPHLLDKVRELFATIYALQPTVDGFGDVWPDLLQLSGDAKDAYIAHYNACGAAAFSSDEREEAAWSKLSGYGARLALVGQCARDPESKTVTGETMAAACDLARWFGAEAERIYATMSETAEQATARRLLEFIDRRGGAATVRDLVTNYAPLKNQNDRAEGTLTALVQAGYGRWEPVPTTAKGGKPTRRFRLRAPVNSQSASALPPTLPRECGGYADADAPERGENIARAELEEALF